VCVTAQHKKIFTSVISHLAHLLNHVDKDGEWSVVGLTPYLQP